MHHGRLSVLISGTVPRLGGSGIGTMMIGNHRNVKRSAPVLALLSNLFNEHAYAELLGALRVQTP